MSTMTKARKIDTWGQFAKLFPSYSSCIDLTKAQQLELVEAYLVTERKLSQIATEAGVTDKKHWDYCLNRHLALAELRYALKAEQRLANLIAREDADYLDAQRRGRENAAGESETEPKTGKDLYDEARSIRSRGEAK